MFNSSSALEASDSGVHPDIFLLFQHYSSVYFNSALGSVAVEWSSSRMTSCAGICQYNLGGYCVIRLSEPLLKLRPPEDLKNTLLHEMIHAYIFVNKIPGAGPDGHGPPFQELMHRINRSNAPDLHRPPEGYHITVYHTMINEVRHYQQHWWECERCGTVVKRAMNRKPQPADCFTRLGDACTHPKCAYHVHLRTCGGTFIKIREPEKVKKPGKRAKEKTSGFPVIPGNSKLTDMFLTSATSSLPDVQTTSTHNESKKLSGKHFGTENQNASISMIDLVSDDDDVQIPAQQCDVSEQRCHPTHSDLPGENCRVSTRRTGGPVTYCKEKSTSYCRGQPRFEAQRISLGNDFSCPIVVDDEDTDGSVHHCLDLCSPPHQEAGSIDKTVVRVHGGSDFCDNVCEQGLKRKMREFCASAAETRSLSYKTCNHVT